MDNYEGHSVTIKDADAAGSIDWGALGVAVLDASELPLFPAPKTTTVNVPANPGGYTYQNEPDAAAVAIQCVATASSTSVLLANLQTAMNTLPMNTTVQIHPDCHPELYWLGKSTTTITGRPEGVHGGPVALHFDLTFDLEDPRPRLVATDAIYTIAGG